MPSNPTPATQTPITEPSPRYIAIHELMECVARSADAGTWHFAQALVHELEKRLKEPSR